MSTINIVAGVISLVATAIAVSLAYVGIKQILSVIRAGQPAIGRTDRPAARLKTMFAETVGHTRMLQWTAIGILHWFVFAGFIFLSTAVLAGYFQVWDPHFLLPIVGSFFLFEWVTDALLWLTVIGIVALIVIRQRNHPRSLDRKSRFFGSTFWQAYFVEAIILGEGIAGLLIRGAESQVHEDASLFHFPLTLWIGDLLFGGASMSTIDTAITLLALAKILMAMVWLGVIARNITMGVAWHRFSAWFNIYFKRENDGGTALGALVPLYVGGKPLDLETMEDMDEEEFEKLGVGKVEDFTWKGILDFSTCTECGRCQSQCPAWNTEKPLSPKLLMMGLREHAYAKIPLLDKDADTLTEDEKRELERPLIGSEDLFGVIDPDVLWSCTNCGACVQQCPVDIEHVDHIDNMRRFQVLVESNFPAELNNIFKGLERKGNPWGMNPKNRMDWAKDLDFEVKQVGVDVESLDEVDWLFWVGCAGAFEDRAKKTTQAVAELLNIAGIDFAVLGDGETCTGDPARRAGNEIVFKQLAMENSEVFKEMKVKQVVSTCAHCFNTLKNEYKEFGLELEVVHHTQLLNRLVREGKLTPVAPPAEEAQQKVTYHDPCFVGRHNQVYSPPRELIGATGATYAEMPRNQERSFCCGAGGARMWMEETLGSRINLNRTDEAIETGAEKIAVGCPFCRVMLADGLTARQADDESLLKVEVLDVAQLLLASVKREPVEPTAEESAGVVAEAEAATAAAAGSSDGADVSELDEPAEDDASVKIAAMHNVAVDSDGKADGAPDTTTEALAADADADEPLPTAEDEGAADNETPEEVHAEDEPDATQAELSEDAKPEVEAEEPAEDTTDEAPADSADSAVTDGPVVGAEAATEEAPTEAPAEDTTDEPAATTDEAPADSPVTDGPVVGAEAATDEAPTDEPAEDTTGDAAETTDEAPADSPVTDGPVVGAEAATEEAPADEPAEDTTGDAEESAEEERPERERPAAPTRETHAEPGDNTNADDEVVTSTDDRPEIPATRENDGDTPAEELFDDVPDSNANDDTAEELGSITAVADAPAPDPVSPDAAPLSDAAPSGADLSASAGASDADAPAEASAASDTETEPDDVPESESKDETPEDEPKA